MSLNHHGEWFLLSCTFFSSNLEIEVNLNLNISVDELYLLEQKTRDKFRHPDGTAPKLFHQTIHTFHVYG